MQVKKSKCYKVNFTKCITYPYAIQSQEPKPKANNSNLAKLRD